MTGKARSQIRHFLKTMQFEESTALGERLLGQALRALETDLDGDRRRSAGTSSCASRAPSRARRSSPTSASASGSRRSSRASSSRSPTTRRPMRKRHGRLDRDPRLRGHGGAVRQVLPPDPRRSDHRLHQEGPGARRAHPRLPERPPGRAPTRTSGSTSSGRPTPSAPSTSGSGSSRRTSAACSPKSRPRSRRPAPTSTTSAWTRSAACTRHALHDPGAEPPAPRAGDEVRCAGSRRSCGSLASRTSRRGDAGMDDSIPRTESPLKAKANGINVHYTIDGSGPWLVMSHSLACDSRMWDEQVAALSQAVQGPALRHPRARPDRRAGRTVHARHARRRRGGSTRRGAACARRTGSASRWAR